MNRKKWIFFLMCTILVTAVFQNTGNIWPAQKRDYKGAAYELIMQWPCSGEAPEGLADVEEALNAITEEEIGVTIRLKASQSPAFEANLMVAPEIELPMFLTELKEAGIDKVIEENQRQYDRWKES